MGIGSKAGLVIFVLMLELAQSTKFQFNLEASSKRCFSELLSTYLEMQLRQRPSTFGLTRLPSNLKLPSIIMMVRLLWLTNVLKFPRRLIVMLQ